MPIVTPIVAMIGFTVNFIHNIHFTVNNKPSHNQQETIVVHFSLVVFLSFQINQQQ
jgi:hypothetical protein